SWGANVYTRALLGIRVRDATSGYRCFPRAVLEGIGLERIVSQGYSFQIEMVYRCLRGGFSVCEVPIQFEDRTAGQSKVSRGEVRKALSTVLWRRLRGVRRDGWASGLASCIELPGAAGWSGQPTSRSWAAAIAQLNQ